MNVEKVWCSFYLVIYGICNHGNDFTLLKTKTNLKTILKVECSYQLSHMM